MQRYESRLRLQSFRTEYLMTVFKCFINWCRLNFDCNNESA